ncbi:MAG TPA: glycosyltransferase family 4 protein [Anaerohalosphaeraceae bacterium]|nr:glycosyltransferase family 4 protein [Anaerohalosphaeraceae bacterium]
MEPTPTKIAILTERADIALGGAERSVRELTDELNRQGMQTVLLSAAGTSDSSRIHVLCPSRKAKRTPLPLIETALQEYLKTNPCDLLHSTLPVSAADIYQPRGGSWRQAAIQNAQSYPDPFRRFFKRRFHFLNRRRTQYLLAEAKVLTANPNLTVAALSNSVKQHFLRHIPISPDRIVVIPNGIRLPEPPPTQSVTDFRSRILRSAGLNPADPAVLFLFAANNFRLKGLFDLIHALALAARKSPLPLVLAVVGKDNPRQARNLAWLAGIEQKIVFCGPLPDISAALAAADAAVLPTWYDPSSRFILEALAMAKPVLTTSLNGAAEFIRRNRHGIIIAHPRCRQALADGLLALTHPQTRTAFSQAILEDNLRSEVSITRHVRQLISLYKQILTRKNKPQ